MPRPGHECPQVGPTRAALSMGRAGVAALLAVTSLACSSIAPDRAPSMHEPARVLFGEVHDNPAHHAARLDWLRTRLTAGARPALLMEMFDREHQPRLDALHPHGPDLTPDRLIEAGTGRKAGSPGGWNWSFYSPLLALAIDYRLPVIAVNVSRADARGLMGDGLRASGFDDSVPDDLLAAQRERIEAAHCGLVDSTMASRMARAQIARDQFMAKRIGEWFAHGFVLIAGNGHVRRDIGVPRWLAPNLRERIDVVGMLEAGEPESAASQVNIAPFDRIVRTPAHARPDPCEALRRTRGAGAAQSHR